MNQESDKVEPKMFSIQEKNYFLTLKTDQLRNLRLFSSWLTFYFLAGLTLYKTTKCVIEKIEKSRTEIEIIVVTGVCEKNKIL